MKIKAILLLFVCCFTTLFGHSLVTVYIGDNLPPYTESALAQARLFNPDCPIYLLANAKALDKVDFEALGIRCIPLESLERSPMHAKFKQNFKGFRRIHHPFWTLTTERFFYLEEFATGKNLKDIFHIELDNMIYVDLNELIPVLHRYYPEAAITFDHDARAIAGFIYFANHTALSNMVAFMAREAGRGMNDMRSIAEWSLKSKKRKTHFLPVMAESSIKGKRVLIPRREGGRGKQPQNYIAHINDFEAIFDPAPIGQWFLGQDPIHGITGPGTHINPYSVVEAHRMFYVWKEDEQGRSVPFVKDNGKLRRINNLHVHSKMLEKVSSLIPADELNTQLP
ncbi:MAG: hypothetical protein KDK48_00855 [Chlamydiia bacterium]|nr:hypothetical protein [Chlamydiia bacterium]